MESAAWSRWAAVAAAALALTMSAWVYYPVTRGYFWADDFTNLVSIVSDGFLRFVLRPFAGHNLILRNLVFYGSWELFGLDAARFFWTVLATHLLCVWLLFRTLRRLTASITLACFGAVLWGTSPNAVGTLGWYSVYGQVLVATILLLALDGVAARARTGEPPSARTAIVWYALLLLGTTCFGIGVGVALVFPAVLFLVLPAAWRHHGVRRAYLALPLVVVAVYFAVRWVDLPLEQPSPQEQFLRSIGIPRLPSLLAMARELAAFGVSSTLQSFFFDRKAYPDVQSRAALALFGASVVVLLWRGDAATRRLTLAMAVLCAGAYVVIAMGRAALVVPPQTFTAAATQLRYHYVGTIPVVIVACLALRELGRIGRLRAVPRALFLLVALALGTWGYERSTFAILSGARVRSYFESLAQGIATEVTSHPAGATVFVETGPSPGVLLGPVMMKRDFPGRAGVFVLLQPDDELDGRRVRFVERDPEVLAWYAGRPTTRLARLLVSPEAVKPSR